MGDSAKLGKRIIILENLRSLHNVGSIFRTADGAGLDTVFLCGYTGAPPDRRIEKVSLGAEEFITWKKAETALEGIDQLKAQGFVITVDSDNTLRLDIIEALVSVQHSLMSNDMKTEVKLQITAETPQGKFVKTYTGVSEKTGAMSADNEAIEGVLNDLINAVLDKIAVDEELQTYIKGNF